MGNLNLLRHSKVISKLYKFPFSPSQPCCLLASPQPQISLLISSMTHLPGNLGCGIWPAYTNAAGQAGNSQDCAQQLIAPLSWSQGLSWGDQLSANMAMKERQIESACSHLCTYVLRESLPASASLLGKTVTRLCKIPDFYSWKGLWQWKLYPFTFLMKQR